VFLTQAQKEARRHAEIPFPSFWVEEPFFEFISPFLKDHARYPAITNSFITNLFSICSRETIDVAIRFGERQDSSVVATRLGKSILLYFVGRSGIPEGRKLPAEPADLEHYDCVMLNARNNETAGKLVKTAEKACVPCLGARYRVANFNRSAP